MAKILTSIMVMSIISFTAYAFETTPKGKIIFTQGHANPNCRTVKFKENDSGIVRLFRIADIATDDDISAVALSALMGNRDVTISYNATVTTGCGSEPRISFITIY